MKGTCYDSFIVIFFSFPRTKTKMSAEAGDCCLNEIASFNVEGTNASELAEDVCCTHTDDVIVGGKNGMAIFDGNGKLKYGTPWDYPFKVTRVSMDTEGIIVMDREYKVRNSKCDRCHRVCKIEPVHCKDHSGDSKGIFVLSTCTCDRDKGIRITKEEVTNCKVSAIIPTDDYHVLVFNSWNYSVYDYVERELVNKVTLKTTLQISKASLKFQHSADRSSNGDIIVASQFHKCVEVFSSAGEFKRKFGLDIPKGIYPAGICIDEQDRIIVADRNNFRVLLFRLEGQLLSTLIPDTMQGDIDLRPVAVATARGCLVVLLHGLPGIDTRIVCIYSGLDKVGHNKTDKADDAPPSYSEIKGCALKPSAPIKT